MDTTHRLLGTAVLLTTVTLGASACSGSDAKATAATPATTGNAPSAPQAPSGAQGTVSGSRMADQATADLMSASSVHITGIALNPSDYIQESIDLRVLPGKGCTGTFATLGSNKPEQLLVIGGTVWVRPSAACWQAMNIPSLKPIEGKYLRSPVPGPQDAAVSSACDLRTELADWRSTAGITQGAATTLDGQKVVPLSDANGTVDVTDTAVPQIVQMTLSAGSGSGGGTMVFSGYNATAAVLTAPPANKTVAFPTAGSN